MGKAGNAIIGLTILVYAFTSGCWITVADFTGKDASIRAMPYQWGVFIGGGIIGAICIYRLIKR